MRLLLPSDSYFEKYGSVPAPAGLVFHLISRHRPAFEDGWIHFTPGDDKSDCLQQCISQTQSMNTKSASDGANQRRLHQRGFLCKTRSHHWESDLYENDVKSSNSRFGIQRVGLSSLPCFSFAFTVQTLGSCVTENCRDAPQD